MSIDASKVRSIFISAVENYTPDRWGEFLDAACGEDAALRKRLEGLLEAHRGEDLLLDRGDGDGHAAIFTPPISEGPGTVIGRYKLLEQIGEGGFGVVFTAQQETPVRRRVALKIIKPGMDSREVVARFETERQTLALMDHPGIARVLDAGATESGRPYFVMELVGGVPITTFCDQNNLTTRERLELFTAVCQAVQHAHQKGVIHRDLKPSNILVALGDDRPLPKVIDFGIAKAICHPLAETMFFTGRGEIIGTPTYMSPEQALSRSPDIDTRTDVYSLGVVLYELLTGTTPFDQRRVRDAGYDELLQIIREEEPLAPSLRISSLGDTLPAVAARRKTDPKKFSALIRGELDWIVLKALEKDRSRRYQTAIGLSADIQRYLDDKPVEACPPSAAYRLRKFARRNKVALAMAAVVAAALVAGLFGTTWQAIRAKRAERAAIAERDEKQRSLYVSHMRLAGPDWESGQIGRLRSMLDEHMPAPGGPDHRAWEWYYLLSVCRQDLMTLGGHSDAVFSVAWSPDGGRLASASGDGTIKLWDAATGHESRTPHGHTRAVRSVAWNRDGTRLASGGYDGTVRIWHAASGRCLHTLSTAGARVRAVAWSPQGDRVASGCEKGAIEVWDSTTGRRLQSWDPGPMQLSDLAWSPIGEHLASNHAYALRIWEASTGRKLSSIEGAEGLRVAWSPDGQRVAASMLGPRIAVIRIWEPDTARDVLTLEHDERISALAWSPDGTRLASGVRSENIAIWDAASGLRLATLIGHIGEVSSLAWSPDGQRLASGGADRRVRIWDPARRQQLPPLEHKGALGIAWSPDDSQLASVGGGTAKIWESASGRLRASTLARGAGIAWSPDSRFVAIQSDEQAITIADARLQRTERSVKTAGAVHQCLSATGGGRPLAWEPSPRLAVAFDGSVGLFDTSTGREVLRLTPDGRAMGAVNAVAWSPDARFLAVGNYESVGSVWDASTGQRRSMFRHAYGSIDCLAWSPEGERVAAGGWVLPAKIWDAAGGQELLCFAGHTRRLWAIAWSPDGKRVASGGVDGVVRIWCPLTGQEVFSCQVSGSVIRGLAWSHDGRRLAGADENVIKILDASVGYAFATDPEYQREVEENLAGNAGLPVSPANRQP